jgi:RNA polymerase sigma-70 factor, ECF subfamily
MSNPTRQREFTDLLAVCQPRVMACIYALIHNIHETEDVYQQACMIMWRKFDTYRPNTQFVKWACEIAYLEAMNYLRQRRSGPQFTSEFVRDFTAWESALPMDDDDSLVQALYGCMDRLNESDRYLLGLRYWEPKGVAEIATELGRTPQSVCNSLSRIRAQLMECVERTVSAEEHT